MIDKRKFKGYSITNVLVYISRSTESVKKQDGQMELRVSIINWTVRIGNLLRLIIRIKDLDYHFQWVRFCLFSFFCSCQKRSPHQKSSIIYAISPQKKLISTFSNEENQKFKASSIHTIQTVTCSSIQIQLCLSGDNDHWCIQGHPTHYKWGGGFPPHFSKKV